MLMSTHWRCVKLLSIAVAFVPSLLVVSKIVWENLDCTSNHPYFLFQQVPFKAISEFPLRYRSLNGALDTSSMSCGLPISASYVYAGVWACRNASC